MRKKVLFLIIFMLCVTGLTFANQLDSFSQIIKTKPLKYNKEHWISIPLITWGADITTIHANGKAYKTTSTSIFNKQGLKIKLFREDNFKKQVESFLKGDINYLRGTMGMINIASDICNLDPRTKLVVIYQHSWSAGGDALVVKSGINSVKDLKGKTIAIQKYGPHIDYMTKLLSDAGLSVDDVKLVWTEDLTGAENTPVELLHESNIDAAFVIIPDALALTSNGKVGTGSEDSVKGAKILLSTKTSNKIISDVYAVRKDYFDANKGEVQKFVKALMIAEEEVKDLFKNKSSQEYKELIKVSAKILLDSGTSISETEGLYTDAKLVGFNGNVQFFDNKHNPRNFENLNKEIQNSFISLGLINSQQNILKAGWDYSVLQSGLKYSSTVEAPKFKQDEVLKVVDKRRKMQLQDGELFSFMIYFQPNQNEFPVQNYEKEFTKVIELASTYGGAIISIEGHSDPLGYLKKKKNGTPDYVLTKMKQSAKNLSLTRSNKVRDAIITLAGQKHITIDKSQFASVGYGISQPKYNPPKTKQQWLENMRVKFTVLQVEAEEEVFSPL